MTCTFARMLRARWSQIISQLVIKKSLNIKTIHSSPQYALQPQDQISARTKSSVGKKIGGEERREIEHLVEILSEEVPDLDIQNEEHRNTLDFSIRRTSKLLKYGKIDSGNSLKIFLAFGDLPALSTPAPASAYLESLSRFALQQEEGEDEDSISTLYQTGSTDIFSTKHPLRRSHLTGSGQLVLKVQHLLLELLPLINLSILPGHVIAQVSESFEYFPKSPRSEKEIHHFWNHVMERLFVSRTLEVSDSDLVRFVRHQRDRGEVSAVLLDCLVERVSERFELFQERSVSEACEIFGNLRYKNGRWISVLGQRLPLVLHEWHYSSIISVAEMFVDLDMTGDQIGEELGNLDEGRELVERISQELWRWIPTMSYNFPSRALRSLVYLDVSNTKTAEHIIKSIPNSLSSQGLHSFSLLADCFIAYSLTQSKSR